jgi:hypothetical protein
MCTFLQTFTPPLLKEISPTNLARLSNLVLQKTTLHTWGLWTSQTEWPTAMEFPTGHGSGQKKLFFHVTDMTILSAFLIHKSCGGKMTHKIFRELLVRELIIHSQEENVTASGISQGRPSPTASQLSRLEVKHLQHCPSKEKQWRYRVWA